MTQYLVRRIALTSFVVLALSACGSFNGASNRLVSVVTPYKIDIVQGNFVSREQADALKPGMSRAQVRDILGTPLVTSLFHSDRWEYVFTLKRPKTEVQTRKLTVFFNGDTLERAEGDEMPSESEFVATLGQNKAKGSVPVLQATEAQLARFPARAPTPPAAERPPVRTDYPPLE